MLNESPKPLLLQFSQSLNTMQQSSFSSVGGTGSSSNGGYVPNTMTQSYSSSAIEKPSYSPNGPGSNNSGNNPHTYGSTPPAKPPRAGKFNTTTSSTTNTAMGNNINNTNSNQNGSPSCSSNSVKTTNTTTAVSKLRIPLALSSQLAADSSYSNKCSYDNYNHSHARVSEHVVVLPPSAVPPRMMTSTTYTTRSESTLSPDHYSSISASSEGYKPFVLPPPLSRVEPIVVLPPPAVPPRLMTTTVPTPYSSVSVSGDGHTPFVLPPPMSRVKPVSTKYDEVCDDDI